MPTALTEVPTRPAALEPPRKRWTRAECEALEGAGLVEGQHLELIGGELIDKMGKNQPHVIALSMLRLWLQIAFGNIFVLSEAPIDVAPEDNPTNEPQPDIMVLKRELRNFVSRKPRPAELHLVVEISDTSLQFDLTTKAALYAHAGIVEYWVLDVAGRRLIVHRDPRGGEYSSVVAFSEHESVAPLAAPQAEFRVSEAFPG